MPYRLVKILGKDKSNSFEIAVQKIKHREMEQKRKKQEYKWENRVWV